jgi:Zn-dependent metalloprotease
MAGSLPWSGITAASNPESAPFGPAFAPQAARPEARAAFAALQARASSRLAVHWDGRTGVPDFLAGAGQHGRLPYTPLPHEAGSHEAIARGFLNQNRALFGIASAEADLRLARVEPDRQLGFSHLRLSQTYQGLAVFGKQLVVHVAPDGQVAAVTGSFVPDIRTPVEPRVSREQAEALALSELLEHQLSPEERARVQTDVLRTKTQLLIYVDYRGHPSLAWQVSILTQRPLGQWRTFVHARRPAVLHTIDSTNNAKDRRTFTARNTTSLPGRQVVREGEKSRDPVAQAAHDNAGKVYDYYFNNFQRDSLDGQGLPIVSTVHYGSDPEDAENAAWIGELQQIIYGDGGRIFEPLAYGLDVVGHELTHGVIDNTSQLIYESQSGALNESYADVFGALIEGNNWVMGEEIIKSPPYPLPYLRSLEDPNAEGSYDPNNPLGGVGQPANMDQYANLPVSRRYDNGGVHINSGVPNHAAFLVAQALGNDKMQQIYYRTMVQYLSPDADFGDAARATVRAAQELYGPNEANAVTQAFGQVGIQVGEAAPEPPAGGDPIPGGPNPGPEQPPQLPAGCTNIVENGDFESRSGWTEVSASQNPIIDPELPRTGSRSAWLGGIDEESLQYIYQDVRIPANATRVQLTYFRLVHEEVQGGILSTPADADFGALIASTAGQTQQTLEELSSAQGDDTWRQATFDLSRIAGQEVRLVFAAQNPRDNFSSFFVDDVVLAACTGGSSPQSPAPPQPSSQDAVYLQGRITSADTGRGIEGAQLIVIKSGLSASDAAADDQITDDEVATFGTSDASGVYETESAIPRGQAYSVIVIANGYRPIVADGEVEIPANATSPFPVDATLRRGR